MSEIIGMRNNTVPPLSGVNDMINLVGKSLHDIDAPLGGSIDEFRVYQGVLPSSGVAINDASGPGNYLIDPGALSAIHLTSPDNPLLVNQVSQQSFTGDFANVSGVDLIAYGGATFTSGDTGVFTVSSSGVVTGIAPGTTTLVATFGGESATNSLTVVAVPAVLTHRYSFTSDASDSIGGANGTLQFSANVSGGKLVLDGGGYVDLPADIINIATNKAVTIEAWVDFGDVPSWCRLFDFGNEGGSSEFYLAPKGPGNGGRHRGISENFSGGQTIDWRGAWTNQSMHVICVLDPSSSTLAVYRDGVLEFARYDAPSGLTNVSTVAATIGRSLVAVDPYMPGVVDEFRIYSGALTAQEVALTQKNGPDSTSRDPGTLNSIQVASAIYPAYSGRFAPVILANYANLTNFSLLPNGSARANGLTVTSSDTNVVRVLANNMIRTFRPGTATLTASYLGKTNSAMVTVQNVGTLAHRYSFTADENDSVGTANGTLEGAATVSGGSLVLDGTPGTYLDLPPGLIDGYDAVTLDIWVTFNAGADWARLWYFGDDRADEFYVAPQIAGASAHRYSTGITFNGTTFDDAPPWANQALHITCVYGNGSMEIYTNGLPCRVGTTSGELREVGNWYSWVGRSPYPNDAYMNCSVDEYRIYHGRLGPDEIQALDAIGPEQLLSTTASVSASKAAGNITLSWPVAAAGFSVQTRDSLSAGSWVTLTNAPALVGSSWQVSLPAGSSAQFFRLWK